MSYNYLKSNVYSLEHTPADHCPIHDANSVLDVQKSLTLCRNTSRFLRYPCSWSNAFTLGAFMENYLRLNKKTENSIRLESFQNFLLLQLWSCQELMSFIQANTLHFRCISSARKCVTLPRSYWVLWHQKHCTPKCDVYILLHDMPINHAPSASERNEKKIYHVCF